MITQLGKPTRFVAPGTCLYRAPIKMGGPSDSCAEIGELLKRHSTPEIALLQAKALRNAAVHAPFLSLRRMSLAWRAEGVRRAHEEMCRRGAGREKGGGDSGTEN